MYQVDSGHLHFTSKKIPICGIDYQIVLNNGADRFDPDQTAPNYEQSDQGLHCLLFHLHLLPVHAFTAMKKVMYDNRLTI